MQSFWSPLVCGVLVFCIVQPDAYGQSDDEDTQEEVVEEILVTSTRSRRSLEDLPTRVESLVKR